MSTVLPSIIVLVITALLVFRRDLTTPRAAPSKPAPGAARPTGRSSGQSHQRPPLDDLRATRLAEPVSRP
jgi:hypothetical protein